MKTKKTLTRKIWEEPPIRFPEFRNMFLAMGIIVGIIVGTLAWFSTKDEGLVLSISAFCVGFSEFCIWRFT